MRRAFYAELDGPMRVTGEGTNILMAWENLGASFVATEPLPERASIEAKSLKIEGRIPNATLHMDIETCKPICVKTRSGRYRFFHTRINRPTCAFHEGGKP